MLYAIMQYMYAIRSCNNRQTFVRVVTPSPPSPITRSARLILGAPTISRNIEPKTHIILIILLIPAHLILLFFLIIKALQPSGEEQPALVFSLACIDPQPFAKGRDGPQRIVVDPSGELLFARYTLYGLPGGFVWRLARTGTFALGFGF